MGCGSSRTPHSMIREMYREPSEFDTCSTVVTSGLRGEPDGKEIISTVGDSSNQERHFAGRKSFSRSSYAPRKDDPSVKNKPNGRSEVCRNGQRVIFTPLTEHNDRDVGGMGDHGGDNGKTGEGENNSEGATGLDVDPSGTARGMQEEDRDLLVAT